MIKRRRMKFAGYVARVGGKWNAYRAFDGETRRKETTKNT
jgi:hypothetical protein